MNRKAAMKTVAVCIAIAFLSSLLTGLAVWNMTKNYQSNLTINGVYSAEVYRDSDRTQVATALEFGAIDRGTLDKNCAFHIYVYNSGDDPIVAVWNYTGNPAWITAETMQWMNGTTGDWAPNSPAVIPPHSVLGGDTTGVHPHISMTDQSGVASGTYHWTTNIYAQEYHG
jgi:hypothetical protein